MKLRLKLGFDNFSIRAMNSKGHAQLDSAKFLALAKRGKPLEPHKSPDAKAEQEYQKAELERSLTYCKTALGLGIK